MSQYFSILHLEVPIHGFFVILGVIIAIVLFVYEAKRQKLMGPDMIGVMIGTLFLGLVGAKLSEIWTYVDTVNNPSVLGFFIDGGKSIVGGFAGAYLGAEVSKKIFGIKFSTGDLFAVSVPLGIAIGRIGCFLTEPLSGTNNFNFSFIEEILFHFCAFLIFWNLRDKFKTQGIMFKIYLISYALFRFFIEFVRGNDIVFSGLTRPQIFLLPSFLILSFYYFYLFRKGKFALAKLNWNFLDKNFLAIEENQNQDLQVPKPNGNYFANESSQESNDQSEVEQKSSYKSWGYGFLILILNYLLLTLLIVLAWVLGNFSEVLGALAWLFILIGALVVIVVEIIYGSNLSRTTNKKIGQGLMLGVLLTILTPICLGVLFFGVCTVAIFTQM